MSLELSVDLELRGRARLGLLLLDGVRVRPQDPELQREIETYAGQVRERYGARSSGEIPETHDARALYRSLGLDPTKTRPSNEALLRRVLRGEALYTVNTLVDALNLVSLRTQLPFGLYDAERLQPPLQFRKGRPGEGYDGIRKGTVNLDGRPLLADAAGAFGNPTSDSARTCVSLETRSVLAVAYVPAAFADARIERVLDETEQVLHRHCGGAAVMRVLS